MIVYKMAITCLPSEWARKENFSHFRAADGEGSVNHVHMHTLGECLAFSVSGSQPTIRVPIFLVCT